MRHLVVYLLISIVLLLAVYRRAWAPELRYSQVVEGNISQTVHGMWSSGWKYYLATLHSDGNAWGRVRPVFFQVYSIPFALTMVRNGDVWRQDPATGLADRINGDLQTHVIWLLVTFGLAIACCCCLMQRITGSVLAALVFCLCAVLSLPLAENVLVYYADSQEIPQIFLLCGYLAFFARVVLVDRPPRLWIEVLASLALVLGYGTKETSVVLMPACLAVLSWLLWRRGRENKVLRWMYLRQMALHVLLAAALLSAVFLFRRGEYVGTHYIVHDIHVGEGLSYGMLAVEGIGWLRLLCISGLLIGVLSLMSDARGRIARTIGERRWLLVVFLLLLFAGFWAINIPWRARLVKYYLPVALFGIMAAVSLQFLAGELIKDLRGRFWHTVWLAGSVAFVFSGIADANRPIQNIYKDAYRYRKMVPVIAKDAAAEAVSSGKDFIRAVVVAGDAFQDRSLPFQRHLNRLFRTNIFYDGLPVRNVQASERNYFRVYPNSPGAELTYLEKLTRVPAADVIYLLDLSDSDETLALLGEGGFSSAREWSLRYGVHVSKFTKTK